MKKIVTLLFFVVLYQTTMAQPWRNLDSLPSNPRNRSGSFTIGGKGYVFAGGFTWYIEDAWAYDTLSNTWSSIAPYPSDQDDGVVGGAINGLGYAGTGAYCCYQYGNSFYQYDPVANQWTQLANFPGQGRSFAVSFVVGGKIYIGGGLAGYNNLPFNDFYAYDPVAVKWDTIAPCPAAGVSFRAVGFAINGKGYVGTGGLQTSSGSSSYTPQSDFWEYDPGSNTWTRKADFGGGPRALASGWATCDKGYIGGGVTDVQQQNYTKDFWQYDPVQDKWTRITDYGGSARESASAFVVGKTGYVAFGYDNNTVHQGYDDNMWSFTPTFTPAFSATPNVCANQQVTFTDTSNYSPTNWQWNFPGGTPDTSTSQNPVITYTTAGNYDVTLSAWNACGDSGTQTFSQYITVTASPTKPVLLPKDTAFCGAFTLNLSSGSQGFTYLWSNGDTTHNITVNSLGQYWVNVSNTCANVNSDTVNIVVDNNTVLPVNPQGAFVCSGTGVTLTVTGGGSNFIWSPSTSLSSTSGSSVVATPTATITYSVSGIDSLGCPGTDTGIVINIVPAPTKPTITVSETGDSLISSAGSYNQWFFNDQPIQNATGSVLVIEGNARGYYYVVVTNPANGCTTTSDSTSSISPVSAISNRLSIYPNPFNNTINVKINSSTPHINEWSLQLTDVLGRTLYSEPSLNYSNDIDLSNLPNGIYFISVTGQNAKAVFPVVKQN